MTFPPSSDSPGAAAGSISPPVAAGEAGDGGRDPAAAHPLPYHVIGGESLPSIAERLGHPGEWQQLAELNAENPHLQDLHSLYGGLQLAVPAEWVFDVLEHQLPDNFEPAQAAAIESLLLRTPEPDEELGAEPTGAPAGAPLAGSVESPPASAPAPPPAWTPWHLRL